MVSFYAMNVKESKWAVGHGKFQSSAKPRENPWENACFPCICAIGDLRKSHMGAAAKWAV